MRDDLASSMLRAIIYNIFNICAHGHDIVMVIHEGSPPQGGHTYTILENNTVFGGWGSFITSLWKLMAAVSIAARARETSENGLIVMDRSHGDDGGPLLCGSLMRERTLTRC